ncbi:MAG: aldo/keto reductase [Chloroflexi bacterium]|nr:aldo/keto reductase [Chloroflexota bacterium]
MSSDWVCQKPCPYSQKMETRALGKSDLEVSIVCFGAWPIGGGMGNVDPKQAVDTIHAAVDAGITFIDTAEGYQTSESVLGQALKGRRDSVILASKLSGPDHSEKHIREAIENSLSALNVEYIDLYQLHTPQPKWPIKNTMEILMDLKKQGKIRHIGLSNFTSDQTQEAMEFGPIISSQPRYNLLFRQENPTLTFCKENQIGVIPHSVLAKGLLGGSYKPGHTFPKDDERRLFNFFQGELFQTIYEVTQQLEEWAKSHGRDLIQLAIAWALANSAVTSAIVGMKSVVQVQNVAQASTWKLTSTDLSEVEAVIGNLQPEWIKDQTPEDLPYRFGSY